MAGGGATLAEILKIRWGGSRNIPDDVSYRTKLAGTHSKGNEIHIAAANSLNKSNIFVFSKSLPAVRVKSHANKALQLFVIKQQHSSPKYKRGTL